MKRKSITQTIPGGSVEQVLTERSKIMTETNKKDNLQRYREFQPTGFFRKGISLEDQQNWLVCPCSRTRDSECLEKSNFQTAIDLLGGESETVEIHRFGHSGPGRFEIIIVKPGSEQENILRDIADRLEYHPILNDEDYYERESEEAFENLSNNIPGDLIPDPPEDIADQVYSELSDMNIYPIDCWFSTKEILQALNNLGYKTEDQIESEKFDLN